MAEVRVFRRLREKSVQRHLIPCPHCGRQVLDHMKGCPFCEAELEPQLAQGASEEQIKRIRRVLSIIGCAVAAALLLLRLTSK